MCNTAWRNTMQDSTIHIYMYMYVAGREGGFFAHKLTNFLHYRPFMHVISTARHYFSIRLKQNMSLSELKAALIPFLVRFLNKFQAVLRHGQTVLLVFHPDNDLRGPVVAGDNVRSHHERLVSSSRQTKVKNLFGVTREEKGAKGEPRK